MKTIFTTIILLVGMQCFSQEKKEFTPGVAITQNEIIPEYQTPTSILFVFEGSTHMVNHFTNLKKYIQKRFKKNYKIKFNFNLNGNQPLDSDLKNIPKEQHLKKDFQTSCLISISDIVTWDNELGKKRKQTYTLNIELKDKKSQQLLRSKLNISTYHTISTQNKKVSTVLHQVITDN